MGGVDDRPIFSSRAAGWGDAQARGGSRLQRSRGRRPPLRGATTGGGGAAQQRRHRSAGGRRPPAAPAPGAWCRAAGAQSLGPVPPGRDRPLRVPHPAAGADATGGGASVVILYTYK